MSKVILYGKNSANVLTEIKCNNDGAININGSSGGGSGGDATLEEQQTQTTHLSTIATDTTSIDGKLTLGQTTKASSLAVAIASDQDTLEVQTILNLTSGVLLNQGITSSQTYTSSTIDTNNYYKINIWGYIDTADTTSTINLEISHDDTDWVPIQTVTGEVFTGKGLVFFISLDNLQARYLRTVLTAGVTSATTKIYYSMK
jgi:hypothetical protein